MLAPSLRTAPCLALSLLLACPTTAAFDIPNKLTTYLESHPRRATHSERSSSGNSTQSLAVLDASRSLCPVSCDESDFDTASWTAYHDTSRLAGCGQPMLLDFALYNTLNDPHTHTTIRCCATGSEQAPLSGANASSEATASRIAKRGKTNVSSCPSWANLSQTEVSLQMAFNESGTTGSVGDLASAVQQISSFLGRQESSCESKIAFAYSGSAAVGVFIGEGLLSQGVAGSVLQDFISSIESIGYSESVLVQLCAGNNRSSKYSLGVIANANADVGYVQNTVANWAKGGCVTTYDGADTWETITIAAPTILTSTNQTLNNGTSTNGTFDATRVARATYPRSTCSTVQVAAGDSCSSLASECGITPAQFTDYNSNPNLCSTLAVGEHVCCSAGTLPDYSPQPEANGTCSTYLVQTGDYCEELAATYSLTVDQIEGFNNNTWGWSGCADLQTGYTICLSSGYPPMPAPVQNAVCGPQVPGTPVAPAGTDYSTLNECPLNACCDIWGQCGTTPEFCTISESATGAPGTAAAGSDGCISNCGTQIVTGSAPGADYTVGYFEGYNTGRPCLNQPVSAVDLSAYTHVHLAFAEISPDYTLDVSSIQDQFNSFITLSGFKKIISVGGWSFCTDSDTYNIFREAVADGNRDTFAANVAAFITEYELDGIDIDWEYPGEPDIPGIPAGTASDGTNYLAFLQTLQNHMPPETTVSFTAPASFWYLKAFPVAQMASYADYIVFMTYDLHGQWDYGNRYSDEGCPGGNCLRSHVNLTETLNSLSMVTKAGVPANKIVVGVSSYGRSFQMTTAGCYTELCTYTGPDSGAYAGQCTQTAGYISNAEIESIIAGTAILTTGDGSTVGISGTPFTYFDENSYSNIAVYDDTQWVAYMDDDNKNSRKTMYKSYNFLGTADWAIDLGSTDGDGANATSGSVVSVSPSIWNDGNPSISCEPPCIYVFPPYPIGSTQTVTWPALTTSLLSSSGNSIYTINATIPVPDFTISALSLQPITMSPTDTATYSVNPVQSVTPTSFVFTLGPNEATFPPAAIPSDDPDEGPAPGGSGGGDPDPGSSTSAGGAGIPGVTFYPTPVPIIIQPQPTISISVPMTAPVPVVTITPGTASPECQGSHCGSRDCGIFGCSPGCGTFTCDGGCGIFGCGGGCGPLGCTAACPLEVCGGIACAAGACGIPGIDGSGGDDPNDDCSSPVTVSACTYIVSSYSTAPNAGYATTTTTECSTTTTCDGADSATTVTAGVCQASLSQLYANDAAAVGTMDSGSLIPLDLYPTLPPDAGATPTNSLFGFSLSTATSNCEACTYADNTEYQCSLIAGCTQESTSTEYITVTTVVTETVTVPPAASANCAYWVFPEFYQFEIYNINGWATDGGKALNHQEHGCGALTGWDWVDSSSSSYAYVHFNLPYLIKAGCVERAIVSAGGPKLSCAYQGVRFGAVDIEDGSPQSAAPSPESESSPPDYTYSTSFTSDPSYTPMTWNPSSTGPITLTWTFSSDSISLFSTETVITNATTVPVPGNGVTTTTLSSTSSSLGAESSSSSHTSASTSTQSSTKTSTTSVAHTTSTTFTTSTTPISTTSNHAGTSASSATSVTPPGPTQSGITSSCNRLYVTQQGDSCSSIESQFDITFAQFYAWNPAIGSGCTALWLNEAYCVGISSTTTSTTATTSSSSLTAPAPTQSGITPSCTQFYVAQSGDSCAAIESRFAISFAQFYAWNPAIGSGCTALWVNEAYCVAVATSSSSSSASSTPTNPTAPAPTQSGITSSCTQYYVAQSGDSCAAIESRFGISFTQFYSWNPAIGSGCTALWVNEAYCVAA